MAMLNDHDNFRVKVISVFQGRLAHNVTPVLTSVILIMAVRISHIATVPLWSVARLL